MHNHIGTVHAIALCNGLEAAMGALAEATIPSDKRWIPKGMEVAYTAKATTRHHLHRRDRPRAVDRAATPTCPSGCGACATDGTVVIEGVIRLWVTAEAAAALDGPAAVGCRVADHRHLEQLLLADELASAPRWRSRSGPG